MARLISRAGRGIAFLLAVIIALASYRYLFEMPPIPPPIALNAFRPGWLVLHAGAAATALLVGVVQFSSGLRRGLPGVHRVVGRVYVGSCVAGALSGLVLAAGSSAGPVATAGFGLLAIAWLATTILGWQRARQRRLAGHRAWMIRSWSLTLAAVTLRLYIPIGEGLGFDELAAYRVIAFLCWVPNLVAAEWLLQRGRACRKHAASAPSAVIPNLIRDP